MFIAVTLALLATMVVTLTRALLGPTVYDRILAVNNFGTKTVLLIAVHGFLTDRPDFLDIALVYAMINFIGTVAVLKFFEYGDLGRFGASVAEPPARADEEDAV
ncbi:MAG: monovalent cation/H+ antiporter complex subunit F [Gammaproteobacteria bacterium]